MIGVGAATGAGGAVGAADGTGGAAGAVGAAIAGVVGAFVATEAETSATLPTTGADSGAWAKISGRIPPNASSCIPTGTDATFIDADRVTRSTPATVVLGSSGDSFAAADPIAAVMARTDVSEAPVTMTFAATAGLLR